MHIPIKTYGIDPSIHLLYEQLNQLEKDYNRYLRQESLSGELTLLTQSIEEYIQGSPEAAIYLREYGSDVLSHIKEKLKAAAAEQSRILEESPAQSLATGKKVHEASCAVSLATEAQETLDASLLKEWP